MNISKKELKIFLTVFLISTIFIHWTGWNENSRLDLTRSILEEGRLEIDNYANNTSDRAIYNNHYYIEKSPISSFLITPVYGSWRFIYDNFVSGKLFNNNIILKYNIVKINNVTILELTHQSLFILFSYILITVSYSVLFTSLTILLVYKFSSFYLKTEWQKIFISVVYWLGTLAFFYSLIFYNHAFPAFLVFLSFYILFTMKKSNKKNTLVFLSGIILGLAIIAEAAIACFFIPLFFYVIYLYKSKALPFILSIIIGILPLLTYNYLIFNNPFKVTFEYIDSA